MTQRKRGRRANGDGSITTRSDGAFIVRISDSATGRRPKRTVARGTRPDGRPETVAQHRRRAEAMLDELRAELARPAVARETWTVEQWATDRYLPSLAHLAPTTREGYTTALRAWVYPHVGRVKLVALTGDHVDALDRTLRAAGLSLATRRHARGALTRVLKHARMKGRVDRVATELADRLAPDDPSRRRSSVVLEPGQVHALLATLTDERVAIAVALMALLGLRRGEALGLGWDHVDFDAGTVTIARNLTIVNNKPKLGVPKTPGSYRTLDLSPVLASKLRAHRHRQNLDRLASGEWWPTAIGLDGKPVSLICTDEAGRPLSVSRIAGALRRAGHQCGLGPINPHALRHAAASSMIASGMDVAAVSAVLGHASPAITLAVYSHAFGGQRVAATEAIAEAIGAW